MSGPVQQASNTGTSNSAVSVTLTATGAGHSLIVYVTCASFAGTNLTVSSITLGATSDTFTKAVSLNGGTNSTDVEIWTDFTASSGQTTVTVNFNSGSGTIATLVAVEEWPALTAVDKTNSAGNTSQTSWSSGATGTLTNANETVVGAVGARSGVSTFTFTGPTSPWTNQAQITLTQVTDTAAMLTGWQQTSATTSQTYSGTINTGETYSAVIVAYSIPQVGVAPFAQPVEAPRGRPGGRGRVVGPGLFSRGAPVRPTPAPFRPPQLAPRGRAGGRGRVVGPGLFSRGAPVRPTPAPFIVPRLAPRGQLGGRGRVVGPGLFSRGAPVQTTPAVFSLPRLASRGRTGRPGRATGPGLFSDGAPIVQVQTLLVSLASAAGSDDYGNMYVEGAAAYAQTSIGIVALQLGTVTIGANTYAAFFVQDLTNPSFIPPAFSAAQLGPLGTAAEMYSGLSINGSQASAVVASDSTASGLTGGAVDVLAGQLQFNGAELFDGSTLFCTNLSASFELLVNGASITATNFNMNPAMGIPPNYPTAGKTLAQTQAALDGLISEMQNRGMIT